jgi:hypothetical protein
MHLLDAYLLSFHGVSLLLWRFHIPSLSLTIRPIKQFRERKGGTFLIVKAKCVDGNVPVVMLCVLLYKTMTTRRRSCVALWVL